MATSAADVNQTLQTAGRSIDIVSRAHWEAARIALLEEEKAFTRARDALARKRLELPWVRIEKDYVFDTVTGPKSLSQLFAGRSQLILQHFMFAPGWDEGCVGCSFNSDHIAGALPHLAARDVSFVAVSRAPLADIERFRQRMAWPIDWVSSGRSDFNYDFNVSFRKDDIAAGRAVYNYRPLDPVEYAETEDLSGFSFFYRAADGAVFHTYSTFARGDEIICTAYMYLDMTPLGRNEDDLDYPMQWWRHHDRYQPANVQLAAAACCCKPDGE